MSDIRDASEILADIAQGWNVPNDVYAYAKVMRSHAEKGNLQRAMEYASDIVNFQDAMIARNNGTPNALPPYMTQAHLIDWSRCLVRGYLAGPTSHAMRAHVQAARQTVAIAAE